MYRYDLDEKSLNSYSYLWQLVQRNSDLMYRYSKSGAGIHLLSEKPLLPYYFCQGFEEIAKKRGVRIMFTRNLLDWTPLTSKNLLNVWSNLRVRS